MSYEALVDVLEYEADVDVLSYVTEIAEMASSNFTMVRGDTRVLTLTISQKGTSTALDVTSATVKFTAKTSKDQIQKVFQKTVGTGVVLTTPTEGVITVTIGPSDTSGVVIPDGADSVKLYYDCQVTLSSGAVYTVASGVITLTKDVTTS